MIGVVVVAHGKLAHELMSTAELILGPQENFTAVSLHADREVDEERKALKKAISKVDQLECRYGPPRLGTLLAFAADLHLYTG